jgi:hypothetical protein
MKPEPRKKPYHKQPLPLTVTVAAWILAASVSTAAASNALSPAPGYTPEFKFSEKRSEKVVQKLDPSLPGYSWAEVGAVDATEMVVRVNMEGVALADIHADTAFSLILGDLGVELTLGEDPKYVDGAQSAFFPTHGWDENQQPVGKEGLSLTWTDKVLTVKLVNSASSEEDAGPYEPAFSANYAGENNPSVRHLSELKLNFGSLEAEATVFLKGSASTSTQTFKSTDYQEAFELTQSSLTGSLDLVSPSVSISGTRKVGDESEGESLVLNGTAKDGFGLHRIQITTNLDDPESWQDLEVGGLAPLPEDEDDWSGGTAQWSYPIGDTEVGSTLFSVRAIDLAGNVSAPTTFTVVKNLPEPLTGRWDALLTNSNLGDGGVVLGALTFQCSASGALTGRATLEGRPYPFKGVWTGTRISGRVKRGAAGDLILDGNVSNIDITETAEAFLGGTLVPAGVISEETAGDPSVLVLFSAYRSPYSSANPVPEGFAGRYNMAATDPNGVILGSSVLSANVNTAGGTRVVGKLADGTVLSWGGVMGASGQVPLYASSYGRRGYFASDLRLDGWGAYADLCSWVRPAGFGKGFSEGFALNGIQLSGQRYWALAAGFLPEGFLLGDANAILTLNGAGLTDPYQEVFTWAGSGRGTFEDPNPMALRSLFNRSSGMVTGGFKLPAAQEGGVRRNATFTGLLVGDRVEGFYSSRNGSQDTDLGLLNITPVGQEPEVIDDPVVIDDPEVIDDPVPSLQPIFAFGVEDRSGAEFQSQGFAGTDVQTVEVGGVENESAKIPMRLLLGRIARGSARDSGVQKLVLKFQTRKDFSDVLFTVGRAGAETLNMMLDGYKAYTFDAASLYSNEGVFGATSLFLGALAKGEHTLEFTVADDGLGNGQLIWDFLGMQGVEVMVCTGLYF